jgi:sulfur relay (sulfurtransferase) DsrF/TusC family protein
LKHGFILSKYNSESITNIFHFVPGVLTVTNRELSSKIREEGRIQKFNLLVRAYDLGMIFFHANFLQCHIGLKPQTILKL